MRVTLDTNVLISGTFWTGKSFHILNLIIDGKIQSVLSEDIIQEYRRVASSNKIIYFVEKKKLDLLEAVEKVIQNSIIVVPGQRLDVVKDDPDDNKIIECAVEGRVEFIISQDPHLLNLESYGGIKIVTPKGFLELIDES